MRKKDSLVLLDLTPTELKVFTALSDRAIPVIAICRQTTLPRTNVERIIASLNRRRLIRPTRVGKRTHWKRAPASSILKRLEILKEVLVENNHEARETLPRKHVHIHDEADIKIVQGTDKLLAMHSYAHERYGSKRALLTQFASAVRIQLKDAHTIACLERLNHTANKAKVITELLGSLGTTQAWQEVAHHTAIANEASSRLVDTSLVPDEFLPADLPAELFIFGDMAMLTDWGTETGVVIHNKNIVHMLRSFFKATKRHGRSYDSNKIFQAKLKKDQR